MKQGRVTKRMKKLQLFEILVNLLKNPYEWGFQPNKIPDQHYLACMIATIDEDNAIFKGGWGD